MTTKTKRFFTPPQAAEELGVTAEHVVGLIRAGLLPAMDIGLGQRPRYRISDADLTAFMESRKVGSTPKQPRKRRTKAAVPQYV